MHMLMRDYMKSGRVTSASEIPAAQESMLFSGLVLREHPPIVGDSLRRSSPAFFPRICLSRCRVSQAVLMR